MLNSVYYLYKTALDKYQSKEGPRYASEVKKETQKTMERNAPQESHCLIRDLSLFERSLFCSRLSLYSVFEYNRISESNIRHLRRDLDDL